MVVTDTTGPASPEMRPLWPLAGAAPAWPRARVPRWVREGRCRKASLWLGCGADLPGALPVVLGTGGGCLCLKRPLRNSPPTHTSHSQGLAAWVRQNPQLRGAANTCGRCAHPPIQACPLVTKGQTAELTPPPSPGRWPTVPASGRLRPKRPPSPTPRMQERTPQGTAPGRAPRTPPLWPQVRVMEALSVPLLATTRGRRRTVSAWEQVFSACLLPQGCEGCFCLRLSVQLEAELSKGARAAYPSSPGRARSHSAPPRSFLPPLRLSPDGLPLAPCPQRVE